jgi:hypothetical protein
LQQQKNLLIGIGAGSEAAGQDGSVPNPFYDY